MEEVVNILIANKITISTMESCTGGLIANSITNIPGASEIFKFGAVTYANEFKIKLGVSKEIIDKYTVYSMNVANEMSKQITKYASSDYGIGVTGKLNRPDRFNPYGNDNIVYISIYSKKKKKHYNATVECIKDTRKENKELVISTITYLLLTILKEQ